MYSQQQQQQTGCVRLSVDSSTMLRFLLCCAFAALALSAGASAFDESLAKDALMWSSGAYGSSPKDCPYNDDFEVLNVLELNSNMCMVGYSETFDSVVLSCRGTNSISQLVRFFCLLSI
jgi:hypothetical protein